MAAIRKEWTQEEKDILLKHYPESGAPGVALLLQGRSTHAILSRADRSGLPRWRPKGRNYSLRPSTTEIDEKLTALYANSGLAPRGAKKALMRQYNRSSSWIYRRAVALGVITSRRRPPDWSAEEDQLLEDNASRQGSAIQRILAQRGFRRSLSAIQNRIWKNGWDRQPVDHWSSSELARCMGVPSVTVCRWIAAGLLIAKRPNGTEVGTWEISRKDAKIFLMENAGMWDHRRADKWFLIDTLGA